MRLAEAPISELFERSETRPLIVHVVRQFLPNKGGLEDVVANLCRQLLSRGFRIRVVTCDSLFSNPDRKMAAREIIDGIEVVRIPWSGSSRYPVAPEVFKHLADADLVHVHAVDFFFDALAWGKFLHHKPMVATTHGGFFHTPKYAAVKAIWFNVVTRLSAHAYRQIVCCSLSDKRLFSRIAPKRAVLIENGADVGKFAHCAALEARRRIITIGRFSTNKRLGRLLDMMQVLAPRHPEWHLDIIGAESDLDRATLEQDIAARGLGHHVALHISVDNSTIRNLIARASIFASASDYEGFGLVAVEAMSAGLLPVLHPNEAYRDLAERHRTIRLVDFGNAERAADAVTSAYEALLSDGSALRGEIVAEAARYSWSTVADQYVDSYATALHRPAWSTAYDVKLSS
jgi:alpha-1,3-mannosyltransferase